jgi:putative ABC transport system ATP-binding protein
MAELAVQCKGILKTYGSGETGVRALRGVDLNVFQGELLMLVGPSGSGKTTLLSILAALMNQDAGACLVFGRDLRALNPRDRARFRSETLGFVFQAFNLLPSLTALENVTIPLLIRRLDKRSAERRAWEELDRVGLRDQAGALPGRLSGGQQQKVAIARALVHDPRLILCDEPTSNLDHAAGQRIMEAMRQRALRADRAVVVVTHDARIYPFADRIARIEDGKIIEVLAGRDRERIP